MTEKLLHGHALFRQRYFDKPIVKKLAAEGQKPTALFIGCSDSRVVPEMMTSAGLGDLFVLRNIANFVPVQKDADASAGAAIEYAVRHLKVQDIIVCGHYGCGGVKAAIGGLKGLERDTELTAWLTGVLPAAEQARKRGHEGDALWRCAVEENVLDAVENLITFDAVKEGLDNGTLSLHAWVYDLATAKLAVWNAERDAFLDPFS